MSVPVVYRAKPKDWRPRSPDFFYTSLDRRPSRELKQIHWKKHIVSSKYIASSPRCQVTAIKNDWEIFFFYSTHYNNNYRNTFNQANNYTDGFII